MATNCLLIFVFYTFLSEFTCCEPKLVELSHIHLAVILNLSKAKNVLMIFLFFPVHYFVKPVSLLAKGQSQTIRQKLDIYLPISNFTCIFLLFRPSDAGDIIK